jgi:hypothetical protein
MGSYVIGTTAAGPVKDMHLITAPLEPTLPAKYHLNAGLYMHYQGIYSNTHGSIQSITSTT